MDAEPEMETPSVDKMYECAQTLSIVAKTQMMLHVDEYKTILAGVKGSSGTKRLASQFIARFFANFPDLANNSLDAIIDLCEDDDVNIRKQAIKDLPLLCREHKEFLPKTADILSQLLQTEDTSEIVVVQNSLMTLFRKDAKGTLIGLFSQIKTGGEEVRERAIKFLNLKIKTGGPDLLPMEAQGVLFDQISSTIEDCSPDEFHMFMSMLSMTKIPKLVTGQSRMVDLIAKTAQIDKDAFNPSSEEDVFKLIQCTQASLPYFSNQVKSTVFLRYFCLNVLPSYDLIESEDAKAQILKLIAELCSHTAELKDGTLTASKNVLEKLMDHLPESVEPDSIDLTTTKFEFTKVECLLMALHTLAQQDQKILTESADTFKELKTRLQFFGLVVQGYIRKLKEFIASKQKSELTSEENQLKMLTLRSTSNISALIKDFLHNPPSFKGKINLSWKQDTPDQSATKRKSISFQDSKQAKVSKPNPAPVSKAASGGRAAGVYAPPTGKYSGNVGRFAETGGRGTGGRGGGSFRGSRRY